MESPELAIWLDINYKLAVWASSEFDYEALPQKGLEV